MREIRDRCLACDKCAIGQRTVSGHLSNVFSNMNHGARIFVIGQNPGQEEVVQGTPFVGVSGRIFDECLKENTGMSRGDLYICNCVSCYTEGNRKPTELEFRNCSEFLFEQINLLRPDFLVTLGGVALRSVTGLNGVMKYHAKPQWSWRYDINVFPLLHPSPVNLNRQGKRELFCDGLKKMKLYAESGNWKFKCPTTLS